MLTLDPRDVRDRLKGTMPVFRAIGLSADLGRVNAQTIAFPSAWVILLGETAGENRYASGDMVEQTITTRVAVIMAVRDIADRSGAQASEDLRPIREALLLTMGRFCPEGADQAFRFTGGMLQSGIGTSGALFWQDDFTLRHTRRIQIT